MELLEESRKSHAVTRMEKKSKMDQKMKPFRVLSLDGGGMRGIYAASYLGRLTQNFEKKLGLEEAIDLGAKFEVPSDAKGGS
jgi:uncharacterized protein